MNEGILKVAANAFAYCDSLETVTFPASLITMCANAFYGCDKIRDVTFLGYEAPTFYCNSNVDDEEEIQNLFKECPATIEKSYDHC